QLTCTLKSLPGVRCRGSAELQLNNCETSLHLRPSMKLGPTRQRSNRLFLKSRRRFRHEPLDDIPDSAFHFSDDHNGSRRRQDTAQLSEGDNLKIGRAHV